MVPICSVTAFLSAVKANTPGFDPEAIHRATDFMLHRKALRLRQIPWFEHPVADV